MKPISRMVGVCAFAMAAGIAIPNGRAAEQPAATGAQLVWSTYLSGTGAMKPFDETAFGCATDPEGNVYVTGSSPRVDFPGVAHDNRHDLGLTAFVCKLDPAGKRLWTTFSQVGSEGLAIASDAARNVYVTGTGQWTTTPTPAPSPSPRHGGGAFVAKLDSNGNLLWSVHHAGRGTDRPLGIAVDAAGSVYSVGLTTSPDFPVASGPGQEIPGRGMGFAFVCRFASDGKLVWSDRIGPPRIGTTIASSEAHGAALDSVGNIYVTGSYRKPVVGDFVGSLFVASFTSSGRLNWLRTPAGGTQGMAIAATRTGSLYVTGLTQTQLPKPGGFCPKWVGGPFDGFVMKLDASGDTIWSTYLGGHGNDHGLAIAADEAGNIAVTGRTCAPDFPSANGFDPKYHGRGDGSHDAFVTKLGSNGALLWSTYLGGEAEDQGLGIAFDNAGDVRVVGFTESKDFPLRNATDTTYGGCRDAFASRIGAGQPEQKEESSQKRGKKGGGKRKKER